MYYEVFFIGILEEYKMSLASYIGCNVEIPLTEPDSNDVIVFGPCFADESMLEIVQEYQF